MGTGIETSSHIYGLFQVTFSISMSPRPHEFFRAVGQSFFGGFLVEVEIMSNAAMKLRQGKLTVAIYRSSGFILMTLSH